ncbi:MAG: flavodoxin family protein, partial [Bradyrhizobium sp.]
MRILYVYCHPLPDSFHAAIRAAALTALRPAGHAIDLLDLYAESFVPVLPAEACRNYRDPPRNQIGVENEVARLKSADALVVQFPTWCFGPPAMFKGFLDRLLLPGVAMDMSE